MKHVKVTNKFSAVCLSLHIINYTFAIAQPLKTCFQGRVNFVFETYVPIFNINEDNQVLVSFWWNLLSSKAMAAMCYPTMKKIK